MQYASRAYQTLLAEYQIQQSMSRRAHCWDNSVIESFFKTLKIEQLHRVQYASRSQAKRDIVSWIEGFYNSRRLHSSNGLPVARRLPTLPTSCLALVYVKLIHAHLFQTLRSALGLGMFECEAGHFFDSPQKARGS